MNTTLLRKSRSAIALAVITISLNAQTFTRVTSTLNAVTTDTANSGGGSWIDVDNDLDLDLFVSNGNLNSQDDHLYINNGGGNFTKVLTGTIVANGGSSIGSTWSDYNKDGFRDCFVTNRNNYGNFLYNGNGSFNPLPQTGIGPVTDIANSNMSSWVDIDNDGDMDLHVVNFQGNDYLYLNQGAPSYSFSANQSNFIQLDGNNFSIPALWADYNNDLKPDLFVGNSGSQNDQLYTNNGGLSFSSSTFSDGKATLGGSWGDYDNDGDLDLFVANFLNQASILYNNSGPPSYSLTALGSSAVQAAGNSVGSAWGDLDNDGDLDLFVCNDGANNRIYLNSGFPTYSFTAVSVGQIVNDGGSSFGCTLGDYDNDGGLDVFVANQLNQVNFLYHNNGNANNWFTVRCTGVISNKDGIGAKVYVKTPVGSNYISQMREVAAQTGYNSQNLWLHYGLGNTNIIDTLIIKWPSGTVDVCLNIPANQLYHAVEGACPTLAFSSNHGYTITCGNPSLSFTASSSYVGPVSYTWTGPQTAPVSGNTITVTGPGSYTATAVSGAVSVSSVMSVAINTTAPGVSVITPTLVLSCDAPTVQLQGTSSVTGVSYLWSFVSPPGTSTLSSLGISANLAATTSTVTGSYTLTVTNPLNLCSSSTVTTILQNLFRPNAAINASSSPPQITCLNSSLTLVNTSSTGIPGGSPFPSTLQVTGYAWHGPVPTPSLSSSNTYTASVPGTYTLIAKDLNNGCTDTTTIVITDGVIYPLIAAQNAYTLSCEGPVTIAPTITNPGSLSYTWSSPPGANVSGAGTGTLVADAPGLYTLSVTNTLGCSASNIFTVAACTGLEEHAGNGNMVTVFPNPATESLSVERNDLATSALKLSLANTLGQLLYTNTMHTVREEIDLGFLSPGIYYLKVQSGNKLQMLKIIKAR